MSTAQVIPLMDRAIAELFKGADFGSHTNGSLPAQKEQLAKSLRDQLNGYWSGSTAYRIMTKGGFLVDAKSGAEKKLTAFGIEFMKEMNQYTP